MFNISFCVRLAVEGYALDVSVTVAVVLRYDIEHDVATFTVDSDLYRSLVEQWTSQPLAVSTGLNLIESQ